MQDELNRFDIFLLDVYMINYYGIYVFFQVCKTTIDSVFLVELATKRYRGGIMLTKQIKASKNPYIILNNNTYTKSTYEVYPTKIDNKCYLPIYIDCNSKLYKQALKNNECAIAGTAYAVPIRGYVNKYFIDYSKIN